MLHLKAVGNGMLDRSGMLDLVCRKAVATVAQHYNTWHTRTQRGCLFLCWGRYSDGQILRNRFGKHSWV